MRPTMMTYISEEPACLAQILRDYRHKLAAIETFARQQPVRRILLLATGSSRFARAISLNNVLAYWWT